MARKETAPSKVSQPSKHTSPTLLSNLLSAPQRWTGFTERRSFIAFLCTAGVMFTFCALKLRDLDYQYWLDSDLLKQFWYTEGTTAAMMKMHIRAVIPIGLLLPTQFIPSFRHAYPTLHRQTGRLLLLLLFVANVTAMGVAPRAFGGSISTRIGVFTLAPIITFTSYKAWSSIRQLRIDRHREWVLRTWSYAGLILTLRVLLIGFAIGTQVLSPGVFKGAISCQEMMFLYESQGNEAPIDRYPACFNVTREAEMEYVLVTAGLDDKRPEEVVVLLGLCFGVAGWAAMVIHSLGVEWYLRTTREEGERLKKISTSRRKAAGLEANNVGAETK